MRSTLFQAALGLSLLTPVFAQDRFVSEIPDSEKDALSKIVEDDPPPPNARKGGSKWISPEYKQIYQVPLPIPPVKQPKQ